MSVYAYIPRIAVGLIFIYAASGKIMDPAGFAESISNYRLLPDALIPLTAHWLPWLEVFAGLSLVVGRQVQGAAAIATGLMAIFTSAVAISYFRGLDINCGCFSVNPDAISDLRMVLLRDVMLMLLCLMAFHRAMSEQKKRQHAQRH